jgi:hypothetical protein
VIWSFGGEEELKELREIRELKTIALLRIF